MCYGPLPVLEEDILDLIHEIARIARDYPVPLTVPEIARLVKAKRVEQEVKFLKRMELRFTPPPARAEVRVALEELYARGVVRKRTQPGGVTKWVKRNTR